MESFVREILERHFPEQSQQIYAESLLIQYLDKNQEQFMERQKRGEVWQIIMPSIQF